MTLIQNIQSYDRNVARVMSKLTLILAFVGIFGVNCDDELQAVVVIFRHGDRTPIGTYANDPYDASVWSVDYGQLTNTGKQQHYKLGQWFRQRYNGFLSEKYNNNEIHIRSTDVDRTLMSAQANLAGLYPPKGDQIWNENIIWQPIPIHTTPENLDNLLSQKKNCPKYNNLFSSVNQLDYFQQLYKNYADVLSYISQHSGENVVNLQDVITLWNILYIQELYNFTLPDWTSQVYPDPMYNLSVIGLTQESFTTEMARLKTGRLLDEIVNYFTEFATGNSGLEKFMMFSAHDITIANVLNSMGVFDFEWPSYANALIFELRKNEEKTYVDIIYKKPDFHLVNITLPSCDFHCSLNVVRSILEPLLINESDWEKECNE